MLGFPKHINTKQDVLNLMSLYPDKTRNFLLRCLDERMQWMNTGKIESGDGLTDDTHKVVEIGTTEGGIERCQYEFTEDPTCKLFRLSFTVEEARGLIDTISS